MKQIHLKKENMSQPDSPETRDLFIQEEHHPAVELKGSIFTLTILRLHNSDLYSIETELEKRLSQGRRFFDNAPIVLDLKSIEQKDPELNFPALVNLLRSQRLVPVGILSGTKAQNEIAINAGLAVLSRNRTKQETPSQKTQDAKNSHSKENSNATTTRQAEAVQTVHTATTKIIYEPIRSGQQVYARGGDLILMAAVNAGAEIIADGNIHVYAPLRGRALAGVLGDSSARIFCQSMEAELVAVAGHYRVFEDNIAVEAYRKPAQIYLSGEQLIVSPLT